MHRLSPTLDQINAARVALSGRIVRTPVVELAADRFAQVLPAESHVFMKLELFQHAGSFKARGALLGMDLLDEAQRNQGVVAASGGNHALAVSWAAGKAGVHAKIVMPKATDPARIQGCRALGAEVVLVDDIALAFTQMQCIAEEEGRTILHPFEGKHLTLGSATCGAEFAEDCPNLDLLVVPVGGGGFISGMSAAVKQMNPEVTVYGVEPYGADSLYQSFRENKPVSIGRVNTIADSLGSPTALPYSFAVARENVEDIVRIEDEEMVSAMRLLHEALKITAEPACSATLAAILGPLKSLGEGKRIGIIACGSNISLKRFSEILNS